MPATSKPSSRRWVLVKDRLPRKGARVWYFFDVCGVFDGQYFGLSNWQPPFEEVKIPEFGGRHGMLAGDVTHWMPRRRGDRIPRAPIGYRVSRSRPAKRKGLRELVMGRRGFKS